MTYHGNDQSNCWQRNSRLEEFRKLQAFVMVIIEPHALDYFEDARVKIQAFSSARVLDHSEIRYLSYRTMVYTYLVGESHAFQKILHLLPHPTNGHFFLCRYLANVVLTFNNCNCAAL